jgi:hypothetical protein
MEEVLYGASLGQKLGVGEDLVAYSRLDVMPVYIRTETSVSKSGLRIRKVRFHTPLARSGSRS